MPTAIIADDEHWPAEALAGHLRTLWPQLRIVAQAAEGSEALEQIRQLQPDVAFLDIQMPGINGLEVAQQVAEQALGVLCVFVTAFEQHAVAAFEQAAVDYLLKPIDVQRLERTVARLRQRLDAIGGNAGARAADGQQLLDTLLPLLRQAGFAGDAPKAASGPGRLRMIRATRGTALTLIPIGEVCYFEAADKYVRVLTVDGESLIRTPLKELLPQLDPERFWQIHRSLIVNVDFIAGIASQAFGGLRLSLRGRPENLPVSRQHAHLFRQM